MIPKELDSMVGTAKRRAFDDDYIRLTLEKLVEHIEELDQAPDRAMSRRLRERAEIAIGDEINHGADATAKLITDLVDHIGRVERTREQGRSDTVEEIFKEVHRVHCSCPTNDDLLKVVDRLYHFIEENATKLEQAPEPVSEVSDELKERVDKLASWGYEHGSQQQKDTLRELLAIAQSASQEPTRLTQDMITKMLYDHYGCDETAEEAAADIHKAIASQSGWVEGTPTEPLVVDCCDWKDGISRRMINDNEAWCIETKADVSWQIILYCPGCGTALPTQGE